MTFNTLFLFIYEAVSRIHAPLATLLASPMTNDKMGGIVTMLCISGCAPLVLVVLTLVIKHRKK